VEDRGAESAEGEFDVIVANIYLGPLLGLVDFISGALEDNGAFIASGLKEDQADEAVLRYGSAGFEVVDRFCREGWTALAFKRMQA